MSSVNYHELLLWQKLSKNFGGGPNCALTMTTGKVLLYTDYSLNSGNEKGAAEKTFELTNNCAACNTNYQPTGSRVQALWEELLFQGKGPNAGPEQQALF